jgi:hypothetical protein
MNIAERWKGFLSIFKSAGHDQHGTEPENEEVYETLTAKVSNDERMKEYFKALDFAFSENDVKNIAVTGPYGAGKSTVILSYLVNQLKKDYINVSLADFSISGKKDGGAPGNTEVELSILQQILYKENKDDLPDSRIDRIQSRDLKHVLTLFVNSVTVILPAFLLSLSLFPKKVLSAFGTSDSVISYFSNAYPERLWWSIILAMLTLYSIVRVASKAGLFDKKLKLSKIAFLQAGADFAQQESSSLLNNCLDEIVYFFSRSKNKIVVFEDLDRLDNTEIFVKLREINQIVNNNLRSRPVRFVYACRDDIFLGSDIRTKFFDFILPVIPVLDARNAYTHLKNKLKDFPAKDDVLLKQLSLYISDMRSLQNMANEFNLFRKLVDENKNEAKIFAIIFYKNMYAQDYNLIDKKAGVLYSLVNDYRHRKLHDEYFISLDEKRDKLHTRFEQLKKEKASSAEDVRMEIICRFLPQTLWTGLYFSDSQHGRHYGKAYSPNDLYKNENYFIAFFSLSASLFVGYDERHYNNFINFEIDASDVIDEYKKRVSLISSGREEEYKRTATELNAVKEEIRIRNAITLADLISIIGEEKFKKIAQVYIDKCDDPDIIDKQQLDVIKSGFRRGGFEVLYYLLTNGYIMQDYMMFRSIFHEGAISANDNDYIKAVGRLINCEEANNSFILDNEKEVITELAEQTYIYREGAVHHQLVEYMMIYNSPSYKSYLSGMISRIFEKNAESVISVFNVLKSKFTQPDSFKAFITLALETHHYLDRMLALLEGRDSDAIQINIIINMIAFVDPAVSDDTENYRQSVEDRSYQLISQLDADTLEPFLRNIKRLGVVYDDITLPVTDTEIKALRFIADNEMYRFSKASYRTVVAGLAQNDDVTCETVDAYPLSLVNELKLDTVKSHIDANIDVFARKIFISSKENSETIVSLLRHPSLSSEVKAEILEKMQFTVPDLSLFQEDVDVETEEFSWHDLFYRYDHVEPGWTSLLAYMYEECNMSVLTGYIEKHALTLSSQHVALTDGDKYEILYRKVICNDELSDNAYAAVLKSLYINAEYWDEDLSFRNFRRIVENNRVSLSPETFKKAADRFGALTDDSECRVFLLWFTQYKDEFLSDTDFYLQAEGEDAFLEELLTEICSSSDFTIKEKATLLINHRGDYSEQFLDPLKPSSDVIKETIKLSSDDSHKISLIIRLLTYKDISRTDIEDMVSELDEAEYRKLFSQQTATLTLSNNSEAESFMSALQERGLIDGWKPRDDGKYFVECRKKSRKEADDR